MWEAGRQAAGWPVCEGDPSFEAPNKPVFLLFGLALRGLCQNSAWFLVKTLRNVYTVGENLCSDFVENRGSISVTGFLQPHVGPRSAGKSWGGKEKVGAGVGAQDQAAGGGTCSVLGL